MIQLTRDCLLINWIQFWTWSLDEAPCSVHLVSYADLRIWEENNYTFISNSDCRWFLRIMSAQLWRQFRSRQMFWTETKPTGNCCWQGCVYKNKKKYWNEVKACRYLSVRLFCYLSRVILGSSSCWIGKESPNNAIWRPMRGENCPNSNSFPIFPHPLRWYWFHPLRSLLLYIPSQWSL